MSSLITLSQPALEQSQPDPERLHRRLVWIASALAVVLVLAIAVYGLDYYVTGAADRPFSPKHHLLKPSGAIGIKLGMLGVGMFSLIFLYPLRKRIRWMRQLGTIRHWLDFHIILGLTAPVIIAFHASFKFGGIAGVAFWMMAAVALSGIVGRYVYAQIPRSITFAELSLKELEDMQGELTRELTRQEMFSAVDLQPLLHMPAADEVRRMPLLKALFQALTLDLARPFHVARLRLQAVGLKGSLSCLGGLLATSNPELEEVIQAARRKAALAKRITFLDRMHQTFHLWHVIHRPFSYTFLVLSIIHIGVVMMLGYI